jgi:outer membrane usher protein
MAAGLLLAALTMSWSSEEADQPQQTYWALVINGVSAGDVLAVLDGDDLWLPIEALQRGGLIGFEGRRQSRFGVSHVLVQSLAPGITVRLDMSEVAMHITAAPRFFAERRIALQNDRPDGITFSHSPSGYLNYSATWDQHSGTTGFGEAGFSLFGTTSTASGFSVDADGTVIRGLSTITIDRPLARQRWQIGDTVPRTTPLGSAPIVAGVSFGKDYSLDPYYLSYPMPSFRGTAVAPSTVEVYINGALVRRLQVGPGPYRLDRLPLNSGLADVRVVVRDPLGRQQVLGGDVYLASGVLRRGEQDYEYVAGVLRDDSNGAPTYGLPQALVQHRIGLTNWLTVGIAGEGNQEVAAAGPAISVRLARLGELELNTWASRTADGTRGVAGYGIYTFISRRFNLSAIGQYYDPGFANIYLQPGTSQTPEFYQASAGVTVLRSGSLTYTWDQRVSPSGNFGFTLPDGAFDESLVRSRSHTLRFSIRALPRTQLSASATYTMVRDRQIWSGLAALNVLIGGRTTATATYSQMTDGAESSTFDLNRSLPVNSGYGFRLNGSDVDGGTASGQLEVNTPFNQARVNYDVTQGGAHQTGAVTLAGGLVVSRGLFFTRPLESSAAVVEVTGLRRVRILADNTEVARTNRRGRALVPRLLPYLANRISYDDADIPFDYRVPVTSQLIAPPYRGAAYVRFDTARIQARAGSVRLSIDGEDVVPSYGSIVAHRVSGDVESPLNADGEFFLDLPAGHYRATVTFKGRSCGVEFDAAPVQGLVQQVGQLRCSP